MTEATKSTAARGGRGDWWRQSIVRRTLSFVEDDIHQVVGQSPFLQNSQPGDHIALFHRSEIVTGARLGKGGFSYVYEIAAFNLNPYYSQRLTLEQQTLRKQYQELTRTKPGRYAIKHLQERLLNDPKAFQCAASDLAIEVAYMSAMDHPNILSVRGLPIDGLDSLAEGKHDSYFLILDRLECTLDQRIMDWRKQEVPVMEKAEDALQLAGAVQYLHDRGIMFRDLKPQNIGYTETGGIQLLDFGLCRELPKGAHRNDVFEMSGVGTRRYMAPEIVNTSCYNDKADVYSWAMVFWEMLSLDKPFPLYSVDDHRRMVCQGGERPQLQRSWPQAVQNLLHHSWTTSIRERLSITEVSCLLKSYIESCKMLDAPYSPVGVDEFALCVPEESQLEDISYLEMPLTATVSVADTGVETQIASNHHPMSISVQRPQELFAMEHANLLEAAMESYVCGAPALGSSGP